MEIHMVSPCLILLEAEAGEEPSRCELRALADSLLDERGLEPWPSLEAECFDSGRGTLIFLTPVRVYIPSIFYRILQEGK